MSQATYVRTETLPLAELKPFPGNAKRGHVPGILESLCRNGQYRSVIVREHDDQLTILAGNHTSQAIAAHGPGDCGLTVKVGDEERPCALCGNAEWSPVVRCEVVTCTDDTARRINLVDNKSADDGSYDQEALAALLGNLGDDFSGTGYGDTDLDDLLTAIDEAAQEEAEPEDEPAPAAGSGDDGPALVTFTASPAERDEAARLIDAVKERAYPGADSSTVVLYGLRTLSVLLDLRDRRAPLPSPLVDAAGVTVL